MHTNISGVWICVCYIYLLYTYRRFFIFIYVYLCREDLFKKTKDHQDAAYKNTHDTLELIEYLVFVICLKSEILFIVKLGQFIVRTLRNMDVNLRAIAFDPIHTFYCIIILCQITYSLYGTGVIFLRATHISLLPF